MKAKYIAPETTKVLCLENFDLLAGSGKDKYEFGEGGGGSGDVNPNPEKPRITDAKQNNLWDAWE